MKLQITIESMTPSEDLSGEGFSCAFIDRHTTGRRPCDQVGDIHIGLMNCDSEILPILNVLFNSGEPIGVSGIHGGIESA